MRRSLSVFGTWTVDEANKTITYNIVSASFPNWEGEAQTRTIDKLNPDEFVNTNPGVAGGRGSEQFIPAGEVGATNAATGRRAS